MTTAVVIPCYRVSHLILGVLDRIGPSCSRIYVVDDACPDKTGLRVQQDCRDPRVTVIFREENGGVGAAVMTGYQRALADGMKVVVKLDGDGQMDPALIPLFSEPILRGEADYCKGNRFFRIDQLGSMPKARLVGNAVLSFMAKLSTGYWNIFDPTNGYTAIHWKLLRELPLDRISRRYFFESDVLFRLNTLRAKVVDIPMSAVYRGEPSHLRILRVIPEFSSKHFRNFLKRLFYNYFLRDFSIASLEFLAGISLFAFGLIFGLVTWTENALSGTYTSAGTVMLAGVALILGFQLLLSFLAYDIANVPQQAMHPLLPPPESLSASGMGQETHAEPARGRNALP